MNSDPSPPSTPEGIPLVRKPRFTLKRLLAILAGAAALLIIGGIYLPLVYRQSSEQRTWSRTLSDALPNNRDVTFIECTPLYQDPDTGDPIFREVVLRRISANAKRIQQLRQATSGVLAFSPTIGASSCFDPHHRVEIVRTDGSHLTFDVCFECRKFTFDQGPEHPLPHSWISPLRQLFTDAGMPPRTNDEYAQLAAEKSKTK